MANTKNEHVASKESEWIVRREGSKKISGLFKKKQDAMEYASVIALNDGGSVIAHKHNGQFKRFKQGNETYVRTHKIAPLITGTVEMRHPIVNNTQHRIKTMISA